jgi:hypothetical protein
VVMCAILMVGERFGFWIFSFVLLILSPQRIDGMVSIKFKQYLQRVRSSLSIPLDFHPESISSDHRKNISHAIFTVAMGDYSKLYIKDFFGTLSQTSYEGDVVLAIDERNGQEFVEAAIRYHPVLYRVMNCDNRVGLNNSTRTEVRCQFQSNERVQIVSINMIRYLFYQWWASRYSEKTVILLADFRDVIFQSNPFLYAPSAWYPPLAQLTVFLEPLPQKVSSVLSLLTSHFLFLLLSVSVSVSVCLFLCLCLSLR